MTPLEPDRLRSAALEELLRLIREKEPPKPTTRISSLGETATATAAYPGTDATSLVKAARGDVDWIVMKALEKSRSRRCQTANVLAADLNRYLAGDPIEARPPSTVCQLGKFASRHRRAIVATATVMAALLAGIVTSTLLAILMKDARDEAIEQAEIAQAMEESIELHYVTRGKNRPAGTSRWTNLPTGESLLRRNRGRAAPRSSQR